MYSRLAKLVWHRSCTVTVEGVEVRWSRDQHHRVIRTRAISSPEQSWSCAVHEYHATFSARNACSACSNTAVYGPVIGYETIRRGRFLRSFQHCSATLKIKALPRPAAPITMLMHGPKGSTMQPRREHVLLCGEIVGNSTC